LEARDRSLSVDGSTSRRQRSRKGVAVPGWFIHSEVAKNVAQHLSDTQNLPAQ